MRLLLKILTVLCIPPGSGFQSFPVTTLGSLPTLRIELDEVVFKFWPHIDVVRDVKELTVDIDSEKRKYNFISGFLAVLGGETVTIQAGG